MRNPISLIASVLVCAMFLAAPALAQSKKELAAQNARLEQRLTILENRMLTGDPAAERLMQRMDSLESSQRALTGEVERLRFERDNLQEEVRVLAAEVADLQATADDMTRHLKAVDMVAAQDTQAPANDTSTVYGGGRVGGVYSNGSVAPGPPTIAGGPDEQSSTISLGQDLSLLAQIGHEKLNEGDFIGAQTAFKQYLELNTEATDRGDISFWLGETYYVRSEFSEAADAYIASMREAPKGTFAPNAMVGLAASARQLGQNQVACQTLASFPTQYPNATPDVREKAASESARSGC